MPQSILARVKLLVVVAGMAIGACATVGPVVLKCGAETLQVAAADYTQIRNDLRNHDWHDLAAEGEKLGYDILGCVLGDVTRQDATLQPAAQEFRQMKSVEFRNHVGGREAK